MGTSNPSSNQPRRRKSLLSPLQTAVQGAEEVHATPPSPAATDDSPPWEAEREVPATASAPTEAANGIELEPDTPAAAVRPAVKRGRISTLSLEEAYEVALEKGKATPSVMARIAALEDFSKPAEKWCNIVCKAPCVKKVPALSRIQRDVLILNFSKSMDGKYRTGEDEDKKLVEIWKSLVEYAMPGLEVGIANVLRCKPDFPRHVPMSKRKVSTTQAKPCAQYLLAYLKAHPPKVIVATDTRDLSLLGIKQASVGRNLSQVRFFEAEGLRIPVIITLKVNKTVMIRQTHSGGMWGPDMYFLIRKDLQKAARLARGEFTLDRSPDEVLQEMEKSGEIRILTTLEAVRQACMHLASLGPTRMITMDIESTGLDPWAKDARILMIQFGVTEGGKEIGIVIPLWHRENRFYRPEDAWAYVKMVLVSDVGKTGHHGQFDLKYIRVTTGVTVVNYMLDTLLILHSRCSGLQKTYGLKKAVWDEIPESGLGGYDDMLEHLASEVERTAIEGEDETEDDTERTLPTADAST